MLRAIYSISLYTIIFMLKFPHLAWLGATLVCIFRISFEAPHVKSLNIDYNHTHRSATFISQRAREWESLCSLSVSHLLSLSVLIFICRASLASNCINNWYEKRPHLDTLYLNCRLACRGWRRGCLQLQHFISFCAWFRFGFLALLNGCAARSLKYETELKCDNDSRDSSVATRYKCILGSHWLTVSLSGFAWGRSFACCMSHVSPGEGCIHFIHISFHAACVWHQIQLSLMCSLCVCLCVSVSPNWYETLLLLLVCSKLNWQRVLPRIQQSTTPSTHNPQYNPTRLTTTKLKHKNLKLSL